MSGYWEEHHDAVLDRLRTEFGYSTWEAEYTLRRIPETDPEVQTAAIEWFESDEVGGPTIAGYDASALVASGRARSPLAAFLTIDWLLRDEQAALESLGRPVDSIVPRPTD